MLLRVRYALADSAFTAKLGGGGGKGIVEADETYIGGKVKGKGRAYKGNKTAIVKLVERGGDARSRAMMTITGENLAAVLAGCDPKARLMTDENPGLPEARSAFPLA